MNEEATFKALVLRETLLGENDKLLTVLAENIGKVLVSCKGVRNIKSRRLASTQLFCYVEFTVSVRNGKYYLKEAELIESFYGIRENIEKLVLAQYVTEVTEEVSIEGEYDNSVLSLALNTLFMLARSQRENSHIKGCFELRLASIIGFMPDLSECEVCGRETAAAFIDLTGGRLICKSCLAEFPTTENAIYIELCENVLAAMRYVISAPPKRIFSFSLDEKNTAEFSSVCERYLLSHLEKTDFDSLKFYRSLGL